MQIQTKITLDHWGNFGKSRPIIYVRFVIKTREEPIAFSKVKSRHVNGNKQPDKQNNRQFLTS